MSEHEDEQEQGTETPEDDQDWGGTIRGVSDTLRKTIGAGIRTVLSNDEGVRKMVRDSIPREVLGYAMKQVDSAKDEVVKMVGNQTRKFLENLDLGTELQKVLTSVSLEFRTELRFIPNEKALRPEGKVKVKVKSTESDDESESGPISLSVGLVRDSVVSAINALSRTLNPDEEEAEKAASTEEQSAEEAPEASNEDESEVADTEETE